MKCSMQPSVSCRPQLSRAWLVAMAAALQLTHGTVLQRGLLGGFSGIPGG